MDRVKRWALISTRLEKKSLNDEAKEIVDHLCHFKTEYQLVDLYLDRLQFLSDKLEKGQTGIPIQSWLKILEMDNDMVKFLELAKEMGIKHNVNDIYWKEAMDHLGVETQEPYMISFFLWKDLGYRSLLSETPKSAFWNIIKQVTIKYKPNKHWNSVLKPFVYDEDFLSGISIEYKKIRKPLEERGISKSEQDAIISLGEKFYEKYVANGVVQFDNDISSFPIPTNIGISIPEFKSVEIKDLMKRSKQVLGANFLSRFEKAQEDKQRLPRARNGSDFGTNMIDYSFYLKILVISTMLDAGELRVE